MLKKKILLWNKIKNFLHPYKSTMVILIVCSILVAVLSLLPTYLFSVLINLIVETNQMRKLFLVFIGYIVVFFSTLLVKWIIVNTNNKFKLKAGLRLKNDLWSAISSMSVEEYESYQTAEVKVRIEEDTNVFLEFFQNNVINYIVYIVSVVFLGFFMIVSEWRLSILCLLIIPMTLIIGSLFSKKFGVVMSKLREIRSQIEMWLLITFTRWPVIKTMAIEHDKEKEYELYIKEECDLSEKMMFLYSLTRVVALLKNDMFIKLIVYGIGGILVIKGELLVGTLFLFVDYFQKLFSCIEAINANNIKLEGDRYSCEKVLELLKKAPEKVKKEYDVSLTGNIEFNNVSFKYRDEFNNIIEKASLNIKQGQMVQLIGASGSGKSTLLKLIVGQIKNNEGEILIDGFTVDEILNSNLYDEIGFVQQESKFFNLSILDNMRLASENVTEEELNNIFRDLDMLDFITNLKLKYHTIIGEEGVMLSSGQRQRLAIARVILLNPPILLLDEATAHLDGNTENKVYDILEKRCKGSTVIFTTHRASRPQKIDIILEINNKKLYQYSV